MTSNGSRRTEGQGRLYDSVVDTIGNTPCIRINHLAPAHVRLYVKAEYFNPAASVKDRLAISIIEEAERRGDLKPGQTVVEATSGNTGIGLAMIAAMKGYTIELVMPEDATRERVLSMEAYGARVILTPAAQGMEGTIDYARAKVAEGGYKMLDQFSNPDNWRAHEATTGPEIWRDTEGAITHFVSSMGTTGTIMGCSRYFKSVNPAIEIVGVRPEGSSRIPGIRRWPEAYLPRIFEASRVDRFVDVSEAQATAMTRRLASACGISVGMSAGGATHAALEVCRDLEQGVVVCVLCDRGDRYLSSGLFAGSTPTPAEGPTR